MPDFFDDDEKLEKHFDQTQDAVINILDAEELDPDAMPLWKIAQAFNVSAQVVEQWIKAGMPLNLDGTSPGPQSWNGRRELASHLSDE